MRASILTYLSGASAKEAIIGGLLLAGIFCVFWSPILLLLFFKGSKRERFVAFAIIALIVLVCVGGGFGPAPLRIPWRIISQVLVAPAVIAFILFVGVLVGVPWYLLRDTHEDKIRRLLGDDADHFGQPV